MSDLWNGFRDLFVSALGILHGVFDFIGDEPAWGFAIIALTLIVRILLLPLAVKQTHSMRGMQELQPKIKAIQKKYKTDREMMRKDPERYKAQRQKMNEEMTALYQEAGVNPAGGCLPLLAQAPIFIALFSVLRSTDLQSSTTLTNLLSADFYFFTPSCPDPLPQAALNGTESLSCGLSTSASSAGIWGIVLIVVMAGSMFWSQRQMMSRNTTTDGAQAQQQKILMYVMPAFLAFISFNFPMGVLLYWVTTNIWQIAQQAIVLHEVDIASPARKAKKQNGAATTDAGGKGTTAVDTGTSKGGSAKSAPSKGGSSKGGSSKGGQSRASANGKAGGSTSSGKRSPNGKPSSKGSSDHLPSRRSRRGRG